VEPPVEFRVETPVETIVETPVETKVETKVETIVETIVETQVETIKVSKGSSLVDIQPANHPLFFQYPLNKENYCKTPSRVTPQRLCAPCPILSKNTMLRQQSIESSRANAFVLIVLEIISKLKSILAGS